MPVAKIVLQDSVREVPLPIDYARLIKQIRVHQPFDGADTLTIGMTAWDEDIAEYSVVGERILEPGVSVLVDAGYGTRLHTVGRFDISAPVADFPRDAFPGVKLNAMDGFALMMDNTWPGDYGAEAFTWTDIALIVAKKYGMGLVADIPVHSRARIPYRTRTRKPRKGGPPVVVTQRVVKNAGDTDAAMLKHMAGYAGFFPPKVRYIPKGSLLARQMLLSHDVTLHVGGRDALVFRRGNIQRQREEVSVLLGRDAGVYEFNYRRDDGPHSSLDSFRPTWDTTHIPMAVRVSGIVRTPRPGRSAKLEVVTVEAEVVGPALVRERANLLRRAQRETDPDKEDALFNRADALSGRIAITSERRERFTRKSGKKKQKRQRFRNTGTAMIEVLKAERRPGREYDPVKGQKVQTMRRETIGHSIVASNGEEIADIARAWLQGRLGLHITAKATIANRPGAELIYPGQIHDFRGLPVEYEGAYMVMDAVHTWNTSGHKVEMGLQKVAELPTNLRTLQAIHHAKGKRGQLIP